MDRKLVKVTWLDASDPDQGVGWYSEEEVENFSNAEVEVVSLGWVKSETKLYLTLVADYIDHGDGSFTWGRPTKIPRGMITKVEDLNVAG